MFIVMFPILQIIITFCSNILKSYGQVVDKPLYKLINYFYEFTHFYQDLSTHHWLP